MVKFPAMICATCVLSLADPCVAADYVAMHVELFGTLGESGNQFTLTVSGDGVWNLELPLWLQSGGARDDLKKKIGSKVCYAGDVRLRTAGNTLMIPNRTFRVLGIRGGRPGVRVTSVTLGTPAAGKLEMNDVIVEVDEKPFGSFEQVRKFLESNRGKTIKMTVNRAGRLVNVEGLAVQTNGRLLGFDGEDVWVDETSASPVEPPPALNPRKDT